MIVLFMSFSINILVGLIQKIQGLIKAAICDFSNTSGIE